MKKVFSIVKVSNLLLLRIGGCHNLHMYEAILLESESLLLLNKSVETGNGK